MSTLKFHEESIQEKSIIMMKNTKTERDWLYALQVCLRNIRFSKQKIGVQTTNNLGIGN